MAGPHTAVARLQNAAAVGVDGAAHDVHRTAGADVAVRLEHLDLAPDVRGEVLAVDRNVPDAVVDPSLEIADECFAQNERAAAVGAGVGAAVRLIDGDLVDRNVRQAVRERRPRHAPIRRAEKTHAARRAVETEVDVLRHARLNGDRVRRNAGRKAGHDRRPRAAAVACRPYVRERAEARDRRVRDIRIGWMDGEARDRGARQARARRRPAARQLARRARSLRTEQLAAVVADVHGRRIALRDPDRGDDVLTAGRIRELCGPRRRRDDLAGSAGGEDGANGSPRSAGVLRPEEAIRAEVDRVLAGAVDGRRLHDGCVEEPRIRRPGPAGDTGEGRTAIQRARDLAEVRAYVHRHRVVAIKDGVAAVAAAGEGSPARAAAPKLAGVVLRGADQRACEGRGADPLELDGLHGVVARRPV